MVKVDLKRGSSRRACFAAERVVKNLYLTTSILKQEGIVNSIFTVDDGLVTCEGLQVRWKEWTEQQLLRKKEMSRSWWEASLSFKGCKKLFDEPCTRCDQRLAAAAKEKWAAKAFDCPRSTDPDVIRDIKSRVRNIMGPGWWEKREGKLENARVPDQQGCYELERKLGGTLSVPRWYEKPTGVLGTVREKYAVNLCRLGTAKTKGKLRVVTMQTARAKRILRPVHERAYDRISSFDWCVRGDVTKEHFLEVANDAKEGDLFFSGDYVSSTDNLHLDAVLAVVDVLCESLPDLEASVLKASFTEIKVRWKGGRKTVRRGSMMGNLCSFVVLCLLNRVALDRARQRVEQCGPDWRKCLINGDDCFFAGKMPLYEAWLEETAKVGFEINQEKTMVSKRFGELNSTVFDFSSERFVRKLSFGFLLSESVKLPAESMASEIFKLASQLSFPTASSFLTSFFCREAFRRAPIPTSSIPRRWRTWLVKKGWFRDALLSGTQDAVKEEERKLPFVLGPPLFEPTDFKERAITTLDNIFVVSQVVIWNRGLFAAPRSYRLHPPRLKREEQKKFRRILLRLGKKSPRRLWLKPTLDLVSERFPEWLQHCGTEKTVVDQKGLTWERKWLRSRRREIPPCLEGEWVPMRDLEDVYFLSMGN
ncbi:RNA dependent RNA polymerase [Plasmopara viticola lesion associated ourmia-like virus 54]|uniref:RNA dependent RNA polymerase n=1 Tax=Plasmopara viticola lesion associated ourmia-like virus 54 TaxID=2686525 RepID=A0ABX6FM85_9VIRU|nr:RNA dependent RNA polymerase [Plasmopara viticola lesion associated ourmia-like virus 54]QGY72584.1 RNA dependent RNA polymerase [Plasmopara viticola lesion associated ourmia-like virus 54]